MTLFELARLAGRAYDEPPTLAARGVEVLLEENDTGVAVAFRGTTRNYRDILADLRGAPWWDRDLGWCHSGFVKGVRALWPALRVRLAAYPDDTPLRFTGHSKGGAEATIAAALTAVHLRPPAALVTFGSPRAGFALGHHLAAVASLRLVNGADAVPRHPWPLWGYRHVDILRRSRRSTGDRFHDHRFAEYLAWMHRLETRGALP